jgi:putative aminopeptidase FrvX
MNIREKFLALTSRTYPHGTETELLHLLPSTINTDEFGNYYVQIGDSHSMFTSHLDTVSSNVVNVQHVFDGQFIKTNGKSILGADDKAGVTILMFMIENQIPGLYYFFIGEEVGCTGSTLLAEKFRTEKNSKIKKVISFDRRGTNSVITYQSGRRCASDNFGKALANELNNAEASFLYKIDPTGVLTDSYKFIDCVPECTNISVGYKNEHTLREEQDITHLEKLAHACIKINWQDLPIERNLYNQ